MSTRRNVLKIIGGSTVLAAASAAGFVAVNQPSKAARAAWRTAGMETEFRRRALSYALLAPNPHNRQPWRARLEGDTALTLYCDLARRLPETDPYDRQITIGHGAFLELLSMAAAQDGYRANITPFPEGETMDTLDTRPVAHVTFTEDNTTMPDPLFAHVLTRRSNKEVYTPGDVNAGALQQMVQTASAFGVTANAIGNTPMAAKLRDLTWAAHQIEVLTDRTNMESVNLMRIGAKEVAANPDGIELDGPFIAAGKLFGQVSRKTLADPTSAGFQTGLDMYEAKAMSARAFAWIANANQTRSDQINAGRAYVRMNLHATALGLGIHPWSQSLQEYAEMESLHNDVHSLIGDGKRLQMLVRVGFAPKTGATPRWGIDTVII